MRRKFKIAVMAGVIAAAGAAAFAARDVSGETPPAAAPAGPQVPVAEVIERIITPSTEFTGFLAAPEMVELRSRVGGTVEAVSVPEGSMVRKGQMRQLFSAEKLHRAAAEPPDEPPGERPVSQGLLVVP